MENKNGGTCLSGRRALEASKFAVWSFELENFAGVFGKYQLRSGILTAPLFYI